MGAVGLIALHSLYRAGFAATLGGDFVTYGLGQRLLWDLMLIGGALALWRRGGSLAGRAAPAVAGIAAAHLGWYSLVLHDPLWSAQAVGGVPLANLIVPLFAALPLCLMLIGRMRPDWSAWLDRGLQPALMIMIALFGWATLRQAFHGTLLTAPGLSESEDILRSLLGIAAGGRLFAVGHPHPTPRLADRLAAADAGGGGQGLPVRCVRASKGCCGSPVSWRWALASSGSAGSIRAS